MELIQDVIRLVLIVWCVEMKKLPVAHSDIYTDRTNELYNLNICVEHLGAKW